VGGRLGQGGRKSKFYTYFNQQVLIKYYDILYLFESRSESTYVDLSVYRSNNATEFYLDLDLDINCIDLQFRL